MVRADIREKARFAAHDPEMLAQHILRLKDKEAQSHRTSCEQELKAVKTRLDELERLMQSLYEDKYSGTVPQSVFQTLMRKYETERVEKAAALPELELKLKAHMENRQDAGRWTEIIRQYTEITKLDESMLFALVDRIEVGEAQKVKGVRVRDVKVYYRYVGNVDDAVAEERREQYEQAV